MCYYKCHIDTLHNHMFLLVVVHQILIRLVQFHDYKLFHNELGGNKNYKSVEFLLSYYFSLVYKVVGYSVAKKPTETPLPKTRQQVQNCYRLQLLNLTNYAVIRQFYSLLSLSVYPKSPPS